MKIACYTSCSINYLAKARVLANTLKENHPDASIVLCMNDDIPEWFNECNEPFDAVWTPQDLGYSEDWIFKHNIMELCTAVKGRALKRLLNNFKADIYAYFDPDVCIYHPLYSIQNQMEGASIGLVPHITEPEDTDIGVTMTEMSVTHHGIYNLGHLFVRGDETSHQLAKWWSERLDDYCYDDAERGLFTDQRWMDLVPAIFDNVKIMREPNLNVASWNVSSRSFKKYVDGHFTVNDWPLLTYHFSGTGINGVHYRVRNIFNPTDITLAAIEKEYEDLIHKQGQKQLQNYRFSYNYFDNAEPVTDAIRKFYRTNADLIEAFPEPFKTDSNELTLYKWLQQNRCDLTNTVSVPERHLDAAFDRLFDESYYLSRYPEVLDHIARREFIDARDHYIHFGSANNYNPNLYFESFYYFYQAQHHTGYTFTRQNQCTRPIEATMLWHYVKSGLANGIEPNNYFDSSYYLTCNQDVVDAIRVGMLHTPLEHFLRAGDAEARSPSKHLDTRVVLQRNVDVAELINQEVVRGVVEALIVLNKISAYEQYDIDLDESIPRAA